MDLMHKYLKNRFNTPEAGGLLSLIQQPNAATRLLLVSPEITRVQLRSVVSALAVLMKLLQMQLRCTYRKRCISYLFFVFRMQHFDYANEYNGFSPWIPD